MGTVCVEGAVDLSLPEFGLMLFRLTLIVCCLWASSLACAADRRIARGEGSRDGVRGDSSVDIDVDLPERAWEFVILHHSATTRGSVDSIHREHRKRKDSNGQPWLGIGYHFVIGNGNGMADGEISPTFRWTEQLHGAHCGSLRHNGRGIGICLIGNFEDDKPTTAQIAAVTRLIRVLADRYNIPGRRVLGHDQVRATACPGRWFPLREVVENSVRDDLAQARARVWSSYDFGRQ